MQFDPLKLFIMCRRDAVLGPGLTQLSQLLREGRHHARNPAGIREHFEAASDSGGCVQSELGSREGVQCDQTTVLATLKIMCREEVGQSLQGRLRFLLRVRLKHVNNIDCCCGAFSARRRGLGIFAVAPLTRPPDIHARILLDPICWIAEGGSTPKIDRRDISQVPRTKSTLRRCIFQED
jgi:hypothetical protein